MPVALLFYSVASDKAITFSVTAIVLGYKQGHSWMRAGPKLMKNNHYIKSEAKKDIT
jgi:bifunctional pyridoxal-dependent enzyme with beta-cystathionase and maltose regulon repressor activities